MLANKPVEVECPVGLALRCPPADLNRVIARSKPVKIGVPKEIKTHEYRVGLTPAGVRELVQHGHQVAIEHDAGTGIGYGDDSYRGAGATVLATAAEVFASAALIVKVKEPQPSEIALLKRGQMLFTYLHLAADKLQTQGLIRSGATCVAYETVTDRTGSLPLLAPMSEVAGRMAVQVGAHCLEREQGGAGILLGGVPGVPPAKVVVLGGGVSGTNAARMAVGLEASVTIIDKSLIRLKELDLQFGPRATTLFATAEAIEHAVLAADLVIGAVLVPGAAAPKLVTRAMVRQMRPGSVLVDIAIDQGGCFETSRPTTHSDPTYVEDGVVHYCVTNMPGAVARTSTFALTNATLPFVLALAGKGWRQAMLDDLHLAEGLNIHDGQVTHLAVARALGLPHTPVRDVLGKGD
jgi:alanine dehydrogenase